MSEPIKKQKKISLRIRLSDSFNSQTKQAIKRILKFTKQLSARLGRRAFYCRALSGESAYNIVVNSDMSVSCNCNDVDGSGRIGGLRSHSLAEIFSGAPADSFRRKLADGKLPILNCSLCADLAPTDRDTARMRISEYGPPRRGIMVENTVACNLRCAACNRAAIISGRSQKSLQEEDIQKIADEIANEQIELVSYFNLGEPFLSPNILPELQTLKNAAPDLRIVISTNGRVLDDDKKREAAMLADLIYFSIDGCDEKTSGRYQRGGGYDRAVENLRKLASYRKSRGADKPLIEWKYVVFNWNDRRGFIEAAIAEARDAGADIISFWPAKSPLYGISWRYRLGSFYKTLGSPSWKGREINLLND